MYQPPLNRSPPPPPSPPHCHSQRTRTILAVLQSPMLLNLDGIRNTRRFCLCQVPVPLLLLKLKLASLPRPHRPSKRGSTVHQEMHRRLASQSSSLACAPTGGPVDPRGLYTDALRGSTSSVAAPPNVPFRPPGGFLMYLLILLSPKKLSLVGKKQY